MDVQTETDPPPSESQSSGKVRKGFKLFGKRKPGNIFTIRNKGDGKNKSPVNRSKTLDGLSETGAPDSEQEPDKERRQEVSQGEMEETLGEIGIRALAHSRNSISSTSSAKSLRFLSLLRGGRRGTGDRQVHTVSQPVGRQRRGLKGLFGTVMLRKDKEDKEEAPPSPLLMSSRANSVEIIKEDLTLTPKAQPRSLNSPEKENFELVDSLSTHDSTPTTPTETLTPQLTSTNVSRTNEHVPSLPTSEPALVPGDNSLSSLLADISSLLTFDSISGGGDILADVEAEWGKVSNFKSVTHVTSNSTSPLSKPSVSSPLTSTTFSSTIVKPSPVAVPTTASTKTLTPLTSSSTTAKPNAIITTPNKSSTLTTHSDTRSSDSTQAPQPSPCIIKSSPKLSTEKHSTASVTATTTSIPSTTMSSPLLTKSTPSSTSSATAVAPNTSATTIKAPSASPALASTISILPSETAASPQVVPTLIRPNHVATPPPELYKSPPVTYSPPTLVALNQPSSAKLDSITNSNLETSTTFSVGSTTGQSKAPGAVSPACTVSTSSPAPSKTTIILSSTTTSASVSVSLLTSTQMHLKQIPTSLVTVPHVRPSPIPTSTIQTQPGPAPVSTPSSSTLNEIPPLTKENVQFSLDKLTHASTTASPKPPAHAQIQTSQAKAPFAPTRTSVSVSKDSHIQTADSKESPAQIQTVQSKPRLGAVQVTSKDPVFIPTSAAKESPSPVSQSKAPIAPTSPPAPCPVPSLPSTPWPSDVPAAPKMTGSGGTSVDGQVTSQNGTGAQMQFKPDELHNESQMRLQGASKERKTPHVKASGLSKIPVVGGGRTGKLPVRESPHMGEEAGMDPPTPEIEDERPHFNSHVSGSKDKMSDVGAVVLTSKQPQEDNQQPPQQKVITNVLRDSKIPVKHSAQPHTASQIPLAKDPPRTKIPVSKVPVRKAGNKPAAVSGTSQIRK